jgi:hypothetical protein
LSSRETRNHVAEPPQSLGELRRILAPTGAEQRDLERYFITVSASPQNILMQRSRSAPLPSIEFFSSRATALLLCLHVSEIIILFVGHGVIETVL